MELIYKIAACSIISAILIVTLRSSNRELSLVLSLLVCVVLALSGIGLFRSVITYLETLSEVISVNQTVVSSLIKVCGISVLVQVTATFCTQAGEGATAKIVELCGGSAAICAMLPLLDSIMELFRELLGG